MQYVTSFVVMGVVLGAIDVVWLKSMSGFYKKQLGGLLLQHPNMIAAGLFYIVYIFGTVMFVIMPAVQANVWWHAADMGALFGLVAYSTYDLTNLATLKGWSQKLAMVDIIWGAVLTAVSSLVTYFIVVWL